MTRLLEVPGPRGPLGWLAVDTSVGGLSFGGLRISPAASAGETADLARVMTWKLAGQGLPVGGAKGALRADPGDPALPDLLARFAAGAADLLRSSVVLGRDAGASDAALDALYASLGSPQLALARPPAGGASRIRELPGYRRGMAGAGAAVAARAAGLDASRPRVLLQGFGAVGRGVASSLAADGAVIVGVSDDRGAYLRAGGFELPRLLAAAPAGRLSPETLGVERAGPPEALFGADADLLVLAALSRTVDAAAAGRVRAGLVVEAANFALTLDARAVLDRRGLVVVPDVIASASAAGLVARQLAARAELDGETAWKATLDAVAECTRAALSESRERGVGLRAAHAARLLPAVRAVAPDADSALP